MEKLLEILKDINDSYDYETEDGLFSERKLDSFDLVGLIADIRDNFSVDIPAFFITEEHFDSAKKMYHLIETLQKEG